MRIYFKKTVWEYVTIPKEHEERALEIVQKNSPSFANEVLTCEDGFDWENNEESSEFTIPDDNDGQATVEVVDDDGNSIWDNGREEE